MYNPFQKYNLVAPLMAPINKRPCFSNYILNLYIFLMPYTCYLLLVLYFKMVYSFDHFDLVY